MGTRPETIKMAPVIWALAQDQRYEPLVLSTGQHGELLAPLFNLFAITPTVTLAAMREGQSLPELTARLLQGITPIIQELTPAVTLVHGDTATCLAGALGSFYARVPIVHVEAGLRTGCLTAPFPEEMNRRLTSGLAGLHLAPTVRAADNLRREGVAARTIEVTGNTVVDALIWTLNHTSRPKEPPWASVVARFPRLILLTAHRRENQGPVMSTAIRAVCRVASGFSDAAVVIPVHPNPCVQTAVAEAVQEEPRAFLVPPLPYEAFVHLMQACAIIVTDSGGIQEEAPTLGRPTLVLRTETERMEAVEAGQAILVGLNPESITSTLHHLLADEAAYCALATPAQIFGDGAAAPRVVAALDRHWSQLCSQSGNS